MRKGGLYCLMLIKISEGCLHIVSGKTEKDSAWGGEACPKLDLTDKSGIGAVAVQVSFAAQLTVTRKTLLCAWFCYGRALNLVDARKWCHLPKRQPGTHPTRGYWGAERNNCSELHHLILRIVTKLAKAPLIFSPSVTHAQARGKPMDHRSFSLGNPPTRLRSLSQRHISMSLTDQPFIDITNPNQ